MDADLRRTAIEHNERMLLIAIELGEDSSPYLGALIRLGAIQIAKKAKDRHQDSKP